MPSLPGLVTQTVYDLKVFSGGEPHDAPPGPIDMFEGGRSMRPEARITVATVVSVSVSANTAIAGIDAGPCWYPDTFKHLFGILRTAGVGAHGFTALRLSADPYSVRAGS